MEFAVFRGRDANRFGEHAHEMRQIVESDREAYLRNLLMRVFQEFACGVQPVHGNESRECHSLASPEKRTERRTVHSDLGCDVVERDVVDIVRHDVGADMLYPPYVAFHADRSARKGAVGRREYRRQQPQHRTQSSQFVHAAHLGEHLPDGERTFHSVFLRFGGKSYARQPVPQFGKRADTFFDERVRECDHRIAYVAVFVGGVGVVFPVVGYGRRNQHRVPLRERLHRIAYQSAAATADDAVEFPRIVFVEFGFHVRGDTLFYVEERVVARLGQFVGDYGIFDNRCHRKFGFMQIYGKYFA